MSDSSFDQIKKENKTLRKNLLDTNKYYTEVCNENLKLRSRITALEKLLDDELTRLGEEYE